MIKRRLTRDGTYTLISEKYHQTYHSVHGSLTEARHVFLEASGFLDRCQQGLSSSILEVGFGTGLNFLLTADEAVQHNTPLQYWAFEHNLLSAQEIEQMEIGKLLKKPALLDKLLTWRALKPTSPTNDLLRFALNDSLSLHLILGDATTAPTPDEKVDIVYLDAFSPDQNPELWTIDFFKKLLSTLKKDGKLVTYSAKSIVRKNMIAAGFEVTKRPGPPGKREMLTATPAY